MVSARLLALCWLARFLTCPALGAPECCTDNFVVEVEGQSLFSVSAADRTCSCAGSFATTEGNATIAGSVSAVRYYGNGSTLTGLSGQPDFSALLSTVNALSALVANQSATIARLNAMLANQTSTVTALSAFVVQQNTTITSQAVTIARLQQSLGTVNATVVTTSTAVKRAEANCPPGTYLVGFGPDLAANCVSFLLTGYNDRTAAGACSQAGLCGNGACVDLTSTGNASAFVNCSCYPNWFKDANGSCTVPDNRVSPQRESNFTIAGCTLFGMASFNAVNNRLYLPCLNAAQLAIIDPRTNTARLVPTNSIVMGVALWVPNHRVYLFPWTTQSVSNIFYLQSDANDFQYQVPLQQTDVGSGGYARAVYNPVTRRIYMARHGAGDTRIYIVNAITNDFVASANVGVLSWALAVNPATGVVYVSAYNGVFSIHPTTFQVTSMQITGTMDSPSFAFIPSTGLLLLGSNPGLYISTAGAPFTQTRLDPITGARDIAVHPVTNVAYCLLYNNNLVSVVRPNMSTTSVSSGPGPQYIVYVSYNNRLYVSNSDSTILVIAP